MSMSIKFHSAIWLAGLAASIGFSHASAEDLSYAKDIAPILRSYCAGCHNDKDKEAKLSVETYAQLRQGGEDHGDPIKPNDADGSYLIRTTHGSGKNHMPPKDEPQMPANELTTLKRWVVAGAVGPQKDESILRNLIVPNIPAAAGEKPITSAAYSIDGTQLAIARTGLVELRDSATTAVKQTISGPPGKVHAVHFSGDGKQLIIATGITGLHGVAQLRDVATGALIREFGGHGDVLYDAEISPDGKMLATAGYDRALRLWQLSDGKLLRTIDLHKAAIFDLAWHPSSKVLASASADETVKLWRVADGVRLDTLNQPQGEIYTVTFTKDGNNILAAGKDKRIYMWKFATLETPGSNPVLISRFAHETSITSIALSSDGKHLLSTAEDRSLKLWSMPELNLAHAYDAQPDIAGVLLSAPQTGFLVARMDGSMSTVAVVPAPAMVVPTLKQSLATTPAPQVPLQKVAEAEPNQSAATAIPITLPTEITGSISTAGDEDYFRFHANAGATLTLEVNAARSKSALDSRLEVLHSDGTPVEQVVLQATRDSWFTFRGKNSDTSDDFRVQNWAEMELNEYLYANGEVVKLWLYPRGPDSGFKVYPGVGNRHTWFGSPALAHALGEPAYIVRPLPPGSQPAPTGLPVFHLNYVNDDETTRRLGADSQLLFTAPTEADYVVKLTDVRGFGGANFHYTLTVRPQQPDFSVSIGGKNPKISPGSGREISFSVMRNEGFDGPVRIDVEHLPPGFTASTPIEIEAGQPSAIMVLSAARDAVSPDAAAAKAVTVSATATIRGQEVKHQLGSLGELQLAPAAKVLVEILPGEDRSYVQESADGPLVFSIRPGQTISAKVRATRIDFTGPIELGKEDCGRNLPHGLYVDNIGLNGLLIVPEQTEREFFLTASPVATPGTRLFHLQATTDGGQTSRPVRIQVLAAQ
jgi:hypothetical protein